MAIELSSRKLPDARPVWLVTAGEVSQGLKRLPDAVRRWSKANRFSGEAGEVLACPSSDGGVEGVLAGLGSDAGPESALAAGALADRLPEGAWRLDGQREHAGLMALAALLGGYTFDRYRKPARASKTVIECPHGVDAGDVRRIALSVAWVRDLINTPANDMGPAALEAAAASLAKRFRARMAVTRGDALLKTNFPMIHAVGRAAADAPRLIDFSWGRRGAPKVTLVGKGVCFDTGGLDIKPSSAMLLMKKDMGGAANVLGLARMIMERGLDVRLRVLIPAVENAISGSAFRPGDVLRSRKGTTVEIGNTDAEGRLVLADALVLAGEDDPDLVVDMATLTGAARVALGPDVPPFYTGSDELAAALTREAETVADPLWRMPLYKPYARKLKSAVADMNNVTTDGFAGSITAALFLAHFVHDHARWIHFDIYGWNPVRKPHAPVGGEAQAIRALDALLASRYGKR